MGIGSALNTALSGLNAFSSQIGYISEDLANTSTIGYKGVNANFQSYVTESSPTFNSPGGVTITPAYTNTLAGQVSSSSVATNFAITGGNGFAPVKVASSTNGGVASFSSSPQLFTRDCDFSVNAEGYLVNSAGQYLQGLKETTTFSAPPGSTIPATPSLGSLVGVRVDPATYNSMPGTPSSVINYNANFPASVNAQAIGAATASTAQVTSQIQFFDSLGNTRTLQLTYQKVPLVTATAPMVANTPAALADSASQWQLVDATVPGVAAGGASSFDLMTSLTAMANSGTTTDSAGNTITYTLTASNPATTTNAATLTSVNGTTNVTSTITLTPDQFAALNQFNTTTNPAGAPSVYFTSSGAINGVASTIAGGVLTSGIPPVLSLPIDWSLVTSATGSTAPQNVSVNFGAIATTTTTASGTTQYAGTSLEVRSTQDTTGHAPGEFQSASIDNNGYVVFSYSNGLQAEPYRIPLVTFSDANKLQRITGASWEGNDTLAGPPVARWAGEGNTGQISSSANEASNVDIADELTAMIVAQRAYSAGGKVITAADELVQETLGLIH